MDKRVSRLLHLEQHKQLTPSWFEARKTCITASSASSLLIRDQKTCESYVKSFGLEDSFEYDGKCCNPYSTKKQYFLDKCRGSTFKGNVATYHCQKYESVVTDLYKNENNTKVLEFGLIKHPEISWLAASPDGITPEGIMLEIKCPYRRKITGITPLYYYIQVQLQLESCDLEFCDFLEYEFVEFGTEEEWLDDTTMDTQYKHHGLMIQLEKKSNDANMIANPAETQYIYPPHDMLDKKEELLQWGKFYIEEFPRINSPEALENLNIKICYWKVNNSCTTRIERNKEWFANVKPVFEKEWKLITYYKKADNYKHLIKDIEYEGKTVCLELEDAELCMLSDDSSTHEEDDEIE